MNRYQHWLRFMIHGYGWHLVSSRQRPGLMAAKLA